MGKKEMNFFFLDSFFYSKLFTEIKLDLYETDKSYFQVFKSNSKKRDPSFTLSYVFRKKIKQKYTVRENRGSFFPVQSPIF